MNEDEQTQRMKHIGPPACNLTLPALLNKVRNGRKNLSQNIVLAHLNQKHSQASKLDSAEVQVVLEVTRRF